MTRTLDFRYVIVRNGADFGELHPLSAPTIRCDDEAEIKTSLSDFFRTREARETLVSSCGNINCCASKKSSGLSTGISFITVC